MKMYIIKIYSFFLDKIFVHLRFAFLPFYFITKLINGLILLLNTFSNEFLKTRLLHCGKGVRLNGKMTIICPGKLHIGNNVHINNGAYIRASGGVSIGDNCHISRNLVLYSQNHNYQDELLPYSSKFQNKPVKIGKNTWIGTNVKIKPGVEIGEGAIIGIGTVVGEDVEPLCILLSNGKKLHRNKEHYDSLETGKKYSGMSGYRYLE